MNRTWDSPELYATGNTDPVSSFPTLAASVANYAIRGADSIITQTQPNGVDRLPGFEETLAFLEQEIDGIYSSGQGELLTNVFEDDVRAALEQRTTIYNRLSIGITEPFATNNSETLEENRERFTRQLADVMMEPDLRRLLVDNADTYIRNKSDLINNTIRTQDINYDVIIKGGGVHTANIVSTLQECVPDIRVLVINDGTSTDMFDQPRLGGQFRYYGNNPVFDMNSGTGEVLDFGDVYGLPKNGGNLNSFGLHAPFQLPDFVATDLPTNVDPAEASTLIIALSGADVVFGDVIRQDQYSGLNYVSFNDESNLTLRSFISPEPVIEATGVGRPTDLNDGSLSIRGIDRIWREFGMYRAGQPHPLAQFAGKVVLGSGCGDSMKAMYKLLFGQGPPGVYRGWSASGGRLQTAYWVAPEFDDLGITKQGYKSSVRPVYASLGRFFPETGTSNSRIRPIPGRLENNGQGYFIARKDGSVIAAPQADIVIRGTGVRRPQFTDTFRDRLVRYGSKDVDAFGSRIALRLKGRPENFWSDSVSIGPVTPLKVNNDVGVPANTISIWSRAPAATIFGYRIANSVRSRRQSLN
jgi:hypothetical protein